MKKLIIILLMISQQAQAQSEKMNFNRTIEIEVDPIAYMLHGYSVHGIYNHDHLRFDLGFFGIEQPASITGNKNFTTMSTGFGVKANYMIGKVDGFYLGLDAGSIANKVTEKESKRVDTGHTLSIGGHAGYRFFIFKNVKSSWNGLYLTPWAGLSYNHIYDKVKLLNYKEGSLGYFATFHIGYRF
ncbi:MAG: hypothetical protein IPN61_18820 [Bacteroidetes bacterium]|nr:hypothetical protein [Bacteroidota bacterium]